MTAQGDGPVIIGEVLFDRFEDGRAVLGGAPFNVAWHLQGLGLRPLFVTRIGDDDAGRRVLAAMEAWDMDMRGVQLDPQKPTGAVQVRIEGGQPDFDILPDQAYDFIERAAPGKLLEQGRHPLLYHGTLIARSPASRAALFGLIGDAGLPVFVDINLRPPWWEAELVEQCLRGARWAKLNDQELAAVLRRGPIPREELGSTAQTLCRRTGLELLILTMGADGAGLATPESFHAAPAAPVTELVDTVGAGDAFSAVAILGLLSAWPRAMILARALGFAARICAIRGATLSDRQLYAAQREVWEHE